MTRDQIRKILVPAIMVVGIVLLLIGIKAGIGGGVKAAEDNGFRVDNSVLTAYLGNETFVTIPGDVKAIGENAFKGNATLKSVEIPSNVETIGFNAFKNCTALTKVSIPDSVTKVGPGAFEGCTSLYDVEIGRNVRSWGSGVFADCSSLAEVIVDEENQYLTYYNGALYNGNMSMLYQVLPARAGDCYVMPKSVKQMDAYAFWNQQNTKNVKTSENMAIIPEYAFANMGSVENVVLTNSIVSIAKNAFSQAKGIKQVAIPSNVRDIDKKAFTEYSEDFQIYTTKNSIAEDYAKKNNIKVVYESDKYPLDFMDSNVNNTKRPNVGEAQNNKPVENTDKTEVVDESNLTDNDADVNDSSDDKTSDNASGGDSVIKHEYNNPDYVHPLDEPDSEAVIGKTVIVNGKAVVLMNNTLGNVYQSNKKDNSAPKENAANKTQSQDTAGNDKDLNEETKDDKVNKEDNKEDKKEEKKEDNKEETNKQNSEENVKKDSNSEKIIPQRQYYKNNSLTNYEISEKINTIGRLAFAESGLKKIKIPENVTTIEYGAFMSCQSLEDVDIADSVTEIGTKAFAGTPWLEAWKKSAVESDFLIVGDGILLAYKGNSKEVTIPDTVKQIGSEVFKGHKEIEKVYVPDSVTKICAEAFRNCDSLYELEGGKNLKTVIKGAFYGTKIDEQ